MSNLKSLKNYFRILVLLFIFTISNVSLSADKVSAVGVAEIVAGVEELGIDDPSSRLILKMHAPADGVFFRTFDYGDTVGGAYYKSAKYYDQSLFAQDTEPSGITKTKIFGLDRTAAKNYLGAVFFGVWSYSGGGDQETIKQIEIPVREAAAGKMFAVDDGNKTYKPRMIWKTGHQSMPTETDGTKKYSYIPCKGAHTEVIFIEYIKSVQAALWEYFIDESSSIKEPNKKLDMMGFKLFSSNDACDRCYESLRKFQMKCREELGSLSFVSGKDGSNKDRPVPFVITFEADTFYYPQNDKIYGSSLFFYPKVIKPLIRLHKENSVGYDCYPASQGATGEEDVEHSSELKLKEFFQPVFILIKVHNADNVRVKFS